MKKIAGVLLMIMILLLTACSGSEAVHDGSSPNVTLIISRRGDKGMNDNAIIGLEASIANHGINLTILEHHNDEANFEKVFTEAVNKHTHMLFTSSEMAKILEEQATRHQSVKMLMYDGELDWERLTVYKLEYASELAEQGKARNLYDNVFCVVYRANEASFLAGYLAASMSETDNIGFVGGKKTTNVDDLLVGFEAGAKYKNPAIVCQVEYADCVDNPEKGKEIAQRMIDDGADIIFAAAGEVNLGVVDAAAENHVRMIGVDADQYAFFAAEGREDLAQCIITSVMKDVGNLLYSSVALYMEREVITGATRSVGLKEGGVSLAKNLHYKEIVPQSIQDEIETLEKKIIDGEIEVPTARNPVKRPFRDPVKPASTETS